MCSFLGNLSNWSIKSVQVFHFCRAIRIIHEFRFAWVSVTTTEWEFCCIQVMVKRLCEYIYIYIYVASTESTVSKQNVFGRSVVRSVCVVYNIVYVFFPLLLCSFDCITSGWFLVFFSLVVAQINVVVVVVAFGSVVILHQLPIHWFFKRRK